MGGFTTLRCTVHFHRSRENVKFESAPHRIPAGAHSSSKMTASFGCITSKRSLLPAALAHPAGPCWPLRTMRRRTPVRMPCGALQSPAAGHTSSHLHPKQYAPPRDDWRSRTLAIEDSRQEEADHSGNQVCSHVLTHDLCARPIASSRHLRLTMPRFPADHAIPDAQRRPARPALDPIAS